MENGTNDAEKTTKRTIHTLGNVRDILKEKHGDRADLPLLLSAVDTVARILHCAPEDIPADPPRLRTRLNTISSAMAGLTTGSWTSVRSRLLKAITLAGVSTMPSRRVVHLNDVWDALYKMLPSNPWRASLGRLIGYCSDRGYVPEQVCDTIVQRFRQALEETSVRGRPQDIVHGAIRGWNAAVEAVPGWPQQRLSVPEIQRDGYVLAMETFTPAFQASVGAYLNYLRDPPDDDDAPLRGLEESTLRLREFQLRQIASAVVHQGRKIEEISSISDLACRDSVEALCAYFERHHGRRDAVQVRGFLSLLRGIARHQLKDLVLADWIARRLKRICNGRVRQMGMTAKNRKRLAVFRDPRVVRDLLLLPFRLLKRAERGVVGTKEAARLVRTAVAIELEIMCAFRLANLAELDLDRDFTRSHGGKDARVRIFIPGDRTKNDEDLELEVPHQTMALVDLFATKYRHHLIDPEHRGGNSRALFPRANGESVTGKVLAESLCNRLHKELGIEFNVHLFRHLACFLYLQRHPGQFDVMRRVLGHKSVETTMRFYSHILAHEAFKTFDDSILNLRAELTRPSRAVTNRKKETKDERDDVL